VAINKEKITNRILKRLPRIGIATTVGNEESQTAKMIEIIVNEIVNEIVNSGEVIVFEANSIGVGYAGTPVNSRLTGFGKGKIT
jgi:CRISPR/Cas system-associated protein endoribonuclease Cas2